MPKLPPRPKTPGFRVRQLIQRCIRLRKGMGLSREKMARFLNAFFLCKEDQINHNTLMHWETGMAIPSGESVMGLIALEAYMTLYQTEKGHLYVRKPTPPPEPETWESVMGPARYL